VHLQFECDISSVMLPVLGVPDRCATETLTGSERLVAPRLSGFRRKRASRVALAAGMILAVASSSSADPTPSLALDPAPAGDRGFVLERAAVHGNGLVSVRVAGDYASAPLLLKNDAQAIDRVVSHQAWLYVLASVAIAHRFAFHLTLPLIASEGSGPQPASGATAPRPKGSVALGDVRLGGRIKLFGSDEDARVRTQIALASSVWLPTAAEGYAGDGVTRVRAGLILEGESRRLYWVVNGGLRTRPSEKLPGALPTRTGTALTLGLGAGFFANSGRKLAFGTEIVSDMTVGGGARLLDPRATIAHVLLTGHWRVAGGPFELGAAFGPGLGQGAGSADYRALLLAGFAPERAAPLADEDRDGIPDKSDACIDLPGAPSGDPLLNGCPAAPPDADGDGIPDDYDACPTIPGEPTGERTTHGCPKPVDSDGDGVPDPIDACPKEPGERPPAGNGCPKAPPTTKLVEQQVVLSQQVLFELNTAVLRPESDVVLGEVARVINEHPELELVEVQGHTDEQGTPELNRRLGQARAESVVVWLVQHGIQRRGLVPKGYGADRPVADNATEGGRQKNRRVEFHVLRTKSNTPAAKPGEGGTK
jgi:OOP family OmpA-OmpF porin